MTTLADITKITETLRGLHKKLEAEEIQLSNKPDDKRNGNDDERASWLSDMLSIVENALAELDDVKTEP